VQHSLLDSTPNPAQRIALGAMAFTLLLLGLYTLRTFLPALAWAAIFAIALWPLFHRTAAALPNTRHLLLPAGFTFAVALVSVLPLILLGAELAREAHFIAQWVQNAQANGIPTPSQVQSLLLAGARIAALWQSHLAHPHPAAGLLEHLNHQSMPTEGRAFGVTGERIGTQIADSIHGTVTGLVLLLRDWVGGHIPDLRAHVRN
jgi:predicted PurR-regulated permease PerM